VGNTSAVAVYSPGKRVCVNCRLLPDWLNSLWCQPVFSREHSATWRDSRSRRTNTRGIKPPSTCACGNTAVSVACATAERGMQRCRRVDSWTVAARGLLGRGSDAGERRGQPSRAVTYTRLV